MREIYIDPAYPAYYQNRLFDHGDPLLNRDDSLAPYIRMRQTLLKKGYSVQTADALIAKSSKGPHVEADYYSFGNIDNYPAISQLRQVNLKSFVIFEPPVVAPKIYHMLPDLTTHFERVYVHNINGDGYSLKGVDQTRLCQLFWPQPRREVINDLWNKQLRLNRIVVVNGNHRPISSGGELYSERIEAMVELSKFDAIDLYGRDWEKWWSRHSMWLPYYKNIRTLRSIYKGSCKSKFDVMSNYIFALCFENMAMEGYVTEKIFDCLYAGTIPIYLGARNIDALIPVKCYIDYRNYDSAHDMWSNLKKLPKQEIDKMRRAGADFIKSKIYDRYYNSLDDIIAQ